jgi:hypothetical protein
MAAGLFRAAMRRTQSTTSQPVYAVAHLSEVNDQEIK